MRAGRSRYRNILCLLAGLVGGGLHPAAHAATWLGGTGLWSDPAGWDLGVPDTAGESAIVGAGQVTLDSSPTIGAFNLTGGTVTATGQTLNVTELFTWSGGGLAGVTGQPGSTLNALAGASFDFSNPPTGTISGWTLNLSGDSTITGGQYNGRAAGAVNVNSGATLSIGGTRLDLTTLTNNGLVKNAGGHGLFWGTFINNAGARVETGGGFGMGAGGGSLNSYFAGTLVVAASGGTMGVGGTFENTVFEFNGAGTISAGTAILKGTLTSTGTGTGEVVMTTLQVNAGQTATVNFAVNAPLKISEFRGGGTLINSSNLTGREVVVRAGGTIVNNATVNFTDRLTLDGDNTGSAKFINNATASLNGGWLGQGALIENNATLLVKGANDIHNVTGTGLVRNSGLIKNFGPGGATVNALQGLAGGSYIAEGGGPLNLWGSSITGSLTARTASQLALASFTSLRDMTFDVTGGAKVMINQSSSPVAVNTVQGTFSSTGDGTGNVEWNFSTATVPLNTSATFNFSPAAPLVIKNALFHAGSINVLGTLTNAGIMKWNTQPITGNSFVNTGTLDIRIAADAFNSTQAIGTATMVNDGVVNHYFDNIKVNDGTRITNNGTWSFRSVLPAGLNAVTSNTRFINNGVLEQKGTGGGSLNIAIDNTATGIVRATSGGSLGLGGGGTIVGDVVADGGLVSIYGSFSATPFEWFSTKLTVINGGEVRFSSSPQNRLTGTITSVGDGTGLVQTNGLPYGTIQANPSFWSAANQNVVLNFSPQARFYFHHAALGGRDGGTITNIGAMEWGTYGTIMHGGLTNNSHNFTISGNIQTFGSNVLAHTLGDSGFTNHGTVTHKDAGYIGLRTNTPINNHGVWNVVGDADIRNYKDGGGTQFGGQFINHPGAVFRKTGTGATDIEVAFKNYGTIELNAGTVNFANLQHMGGTVRINGGTMGGAANITVVGGTLCGHGTITGRVIGGATAHTIAPSAGLTPDSTGTLTVGGLTTSSATNLTFNLNGPGATGTSDRIKITSANGLSLANGVTISLLGTTTGAGSLGYYHIIEHNGYTGSLAGVAMPSGTGNLVYALQPGGGTGFIDVHVGFLGDANDDGGVTFNDFITLANNFGQTNAGWSGADFNNDGATSFTDFILLANQFGQSIDGDGLVVSADEIAAFETASAAFLASVGVPEPASLLLLGLGAAGLLVRRRR